VYASLNAYGDIGPWASRPGWEQLAQACTGMQERYGGDGPAVLQPYAINDYGTGFMGAYGVALALLHKQKTGQGQHVQTALARTACTLQSLFMQDYEGKTWDEPRGQDAIGDGPLHRLYRANDGWFFLAGRDSDRPRFARVEGLEEAASLEGDALETFLEARIAGECVQCWVERLNAAGFGAHRTASVNELMTDPWVQAHGLSITREHDGAGLITTNGPSPRLSRTPAVPGRAASLPGADALDILRDLGRDTDIDRLVDARAVVIEGVTTR
jgi:crotonobetainyl-CoA:carnitine CoA-transferase CaiB-like acyl-CoA transferase